MIKLRNREGELPLLIISTSEYAVKSASITAENSFSSVIPLQKTHPWTLEIIRGVVCTLEVRTETASV